MTGWDLNAPSRETIGHGLRQKAIGREPYSSKDCFWELKPG
jgi:hypothetical protein